MNAITGKTYSLFGEASSSDEYFQTVKELTDFFLKKYYPGEDELLRLIRSLQRKRFFERTNVKLKFISDSLKYHLSQYTRGVRQHLKDMSLFQLFDSTLRTKEYRYFFYMLEIELVNRIYLDRFKQADFKMALFPHCLRDFRPRCLSVAGDVEHICRGCTKDCYINMGSSLLHHNGIAAYISVTIDQKNLFKQLKNEHPNMAVLGIACIPELAMGMRLCEKLDIPAIGIPLDANRCARWMEQAHETSFNLTMLERLIQ